MLRTRDKADRAVVAELARRGIRQGDAKAMNKGDAYALALITPRAADAPMVEPSPMEEAPIYRVCYSGPSGQSAAVECSSERKAMRVARGARPAWATSVVVTDDMGMPLASL